MASSYVFRTGDLPKLDLDTDRGTDFHAWHQQWQAYRSLSGLNAEPAAKQVQALQLCFSRETLNVVENLGLTTDERKDQAQIIAAMKRHVAVESTRPSSDGTSVNGHSRLANHSTTTSSHFVSSPRRATSAIMTASSRLSVTKSSRAFLTVKSSKNCYR